MEVHNIHDGTSADVMDVMSALGSTHPYGVGWRPGPPPGAVVVAAPVIDVVPSTDGIWRAPARLVNVGSGNAPIVGGPKGNEGKLRRKRAAFGQLPFASDGIDIITTAIRGEDRGDYPVTLRDLTITEGGALSIGGDALPMTLRAFRGLLAQTSTDAKRWLGGFDVAPPGELGRAWGIAKERGMFDVDKVVRIGGRMGYDGVAEAYRVVSQHYSEEDVDTTAILDTARETLASLDGEGYRLDGFYNPDTTSVRLTFLRHVDTLAGLQTGDVFKAGFTLHTNDAGAGGIGTYHSAWRAMCLNMARIKRINSGRQSLRHKRSDSLAGRVDALIRTTAEENVAMVGTFVGQWNLGRRKIADHPRFAGIGPVIGPDGKADTAALASVMEVIAGLRSMRTAAVARDTAVEVLTGGWLLEPGDDIRAVVNAVTRAHERVTLDTLPMWEEAGGDLLAELTS